MRKEEFLTKWEYLQDIPSRLLTEGIYIDNEGFRILVYDYRDGTKNFRISFKRILAYRVTDERYLLKTLADKSLITSKEINTCFFIVNNSSFVELYLEQSGIKELESPITHYAIYTSDDCIDVLSDCVPLIECLGSMM